MPVLWYISNFRVTGLAEGALKRMMVITTWAPRIMQLLPAPVMLPSPTVCGIPVLTPSVQTPSNLYPQRHPAAPAAGCRMNVNRREE